MAHIPFVLCLVSPTNANAPCAYACIRAMGKFYNTTSGITIPLPQLIEEISVVSVLFIMMGAPFIIIGLYIFLFLFGSLSSIAILTVKTIWLV